MHVSVCESVHVSAVPVEAGGGCQILWSHLVAARN